MKSIETVNKLNFVLIFVYFIAINDLLISSVSCVPLTLHANNVDDDDVAMNDANEIRKQQQQKLNDLNAFVVNNGNEEDDEWQSIRRRKRSGISDQRLAELETLLALQRLRDYQRRVKTPVAYGLFDPDKIGKRKRRSKDAVESITPN